ncbi:MAG: hypothetical protein M0O96_10440 [Desulforhopalus sp.]|nr:hypothetical protein [Desulforhopalus sp.]
MPCLYGGVATVAATITEKSQNNTTSLTKTGTTMIPAMLWSFVETRHALSTNLAPDNPDEINEIGNYHGCKGGCITL